jgi:hypothetical protein
LDRGNWNALPAWERNLVPLRGCVSPSEANDFENLGSDRAHPGFRIS